MPSVIKSVTPGTPAARAHIRPGDRLTAVNGHQILDVLDYKYYTYDARVTLKTVSPDGTVHVHTIRKQEGEDPGLEFETYLMDKARCCANRCIFCFVDQLPAGLRETLYFKDDDARLSFLTGNYITLTNLSQREIERICALRISPINISVHATDPQLRCRMLQNRRGGELMDIMRRFADAGISMDCQIVCCPDVNDGSQLARTMEDLCGLFPAVNSVSVVPVGLTKYRSGLTPITPFDRERAAQTVDQVEAFAADCRKKCGSRIFFCADELYLKAGRPLPPDEAYEGYPQLENGVGMLRLLEVEFTDAMEELTPGRQTDFSVATGVSAAPYIRALLDRAAARYGGVNGTVYPIVNDFFGHTINVTGLVTGGDLIRQLKGKELGERLLIPRNMLRHGETVFLDDVTLAQVEQELQVRTVEVEQDGRQLLKAVLGLE